MVVIKQEENDEESRGTEGARRATGVRREADSGDGGRADPEVSAQATRRRFSADYKRQIVHEADKCTQPGELGALLRREGLYSSSLSVWRRQRDAGELTGLRPSRRGRKARSKDARDQRIAELERLTRRLEAQLARAETVIAIQKKVSTLLGIPLMSPDQAEQD